MYEGIGQLCAFVIKKKIRSIERAVASTREIWTLWSSVLDKNSDCEWNTYQAAVEPPIVTLGTAISADCPRGAKSPWTVHAEVPLRKRLRTRAHVRPLPMGCDSFSIVLAWSGTIESVFSSAASAVVWVDSWAVLLLEWRMWRPHLPGYGLGRARRILLINESLFAWGWHVSAL